MLAAFAFLAFWVVVAIVLLFVALRGGPRGARATLQSQSRRSRRAAAVFFTLFYVGIGVAVPLLLITGNRDEAGATVNGASVHLTARERHGQDIFGLRCASCHTLAAAHADGKVGPNLDQLTPPRALVLDAVLHGRQRGNGTMPAAIVQGQDAAAVAAFVAQAAGK
jgi:mono/diheme cytochrome c family protein